MTSLSLTLFISLALLYCHVSTGQGVDRFVYQQVFQLALLPRDSQANIAQAQKAVIELVTAHYNMARGVYYPIGTATGLFTAAGRKKRFANFGSSFGSDWGSSSRYDPWGSFPFSSFYGGSHNNQNVNHHPPSTNQNTNKHYSGGGNTYTSFGQNREIIHCPSQANQSAVYMLNSSSVAYPTTDIGNEFFVRSLPGSDLFFQCAIRKAVLPGQGPVVDVDQNFVTANHTCKSTDLTLFSYMYQNTAIGGRCWVVQGFQEPVLFSVCQQKSCENCKLKPTNTRSSSYGHPHPQQNYGTRNVTVNQCLQEYRTAQVLSYCENLPANQRIIDDRIVIPLSCSCKSVDCMTNPHW